MKKLFIIMFTIISSFQLLGQTTYTDISFMYTSLDIPTSPDNIAMGESFVANKNSARSFFVNPAALSDSKRITAFYDYRSMAWNSLLSNANYISAGLAISSPGGNYGFSTSQFSSGFLQSGATDQNKTLDKNKTLTFSYSRRFLNNLSFGLSFKVFNRIQTSTGQPKSEIVSDNSYLFDFGALYEFNPIINSEHAVDKLNVGFSIQNFGTKYTEEFRQLFVEKTDRKLPRYLRAGFAYGIDLELGEKSQFNIDLLFTGEYKRHVNPAPYENGKVDYYGIGFESTFLRVFSLRIGGYSSPLENILYKKNELNIRYGAGLKIPASVVGLTYPVTLNFDFALIPIQQYNFPITTIQNPEGKTETTKSSLSSFGLSLNYSF